MEYIGEFKEEYLKECAEIYPSIFNREPWNEKWTEKTAYERLKEVYNTPNFKGGVCIREGKIIGAILGNLEHWDEGLKYSLKEFFIDTSIQGAGVGSRIIKFIEKHLKDINVKSIELYTLKDRRTQGFYNKNGYKIHRNTIIMEKNI